MGHATIDPSCLSIGQCATLACLLEASVPKPGNVHRGADFDDLTFYDFVVSATAIGPLMDQAAAMGVGRTVLCAIQAIRHWTATNTHLGTILLLAPLAAVPPDRGLPSGVVAVLENLTAKDATDVYEAIRLARPGGLGRVEQWDVHDPAPADLLAAMQAAAAHDSIARQYVTGFDTVDRVAAWLTEGTGTSLADTIIHTQLRLMAELPDSLIQRKCGLEVARSASQRAHRVLDAGPSGSENYLRELAEFDFWLRSDGHRRNPGTTADLIAAGLFVALRERKLRPPL